MEWGAHTFLGLRSSELSLGQRLVPSSVAAHGGRFVPVYFHLQDLSSFPNYLTGI